MIVSRGEVVSLLDEINVYSRSVHGYQEKVTDSETLYAYVDDADKVSIWMNSLRSFITIDKRELAREIRDNGRLEKGVYCSWVGSILQVREVQ